MILHKGETLFHQGDSGDLFYVKSGMLKIVRVHEDGHPFLVNLIVEGETIPHHSLISPMPYHGTAVALISSEIERIPAAQWYKQLRGDADKSIEVAAILQSKLRMMQQRIDQLTQVAPADKLARLEQWFQTYIAPDTMSDILTQDEIGQLVGLRRETVNRLMRANRSNRSAKKS